MLGGIEIIYQRLTAQEATGYWRARSTPRLNLSEERTEEDWERLELQLKTLLKIKNICFKSCLPIRLLQVIPSYSST